MHWIDPDHLPRATGKVAQFLINPHGEIDGMVLADGMEVHCPPHLSQAIARVIAIGDTVAVDGVRPRGVAMISAVAITASDGERIVDEGPQREGPPGHRRKPPAQPHGTLQQVSGVVAIALHGPKGEVRGVLLEGGVAIRFPKHEGARLAEVVRTGSAFAARGTLVETAHGAVLDACEVGASATTLRPVDAEDPARDPHHKGPRHGPHHNPPKHPPHRGGRGDHHHARDA